MEFSSLLKPDFLLFFFLCLFALRWWKFLKVRRQLPILLAQGAQIIDVRTPAEFAQGSHPDSINLPLAELTNKISEIDRSKPLILCCASGARSAAALRLLKQQGFKSLYNIGSWRHTLIR